MGPLHERSGEAESTVWAHWIFELLQWGRCMNAAESLQLAVGYGIHGVRLQWGRCMNAAESCWLFRTFALEYPASMGPLHERSGELVYCYTWSDSTNNA